VDAGNTALSTMYFLEHWSLLPTEAVKAACANLITRCEEFGLPTDGLQKLAAAQGMARNRDPLKQGAYVGDDADWAQRTNLISVRGNSDSGRVTPMANNMKTAGAHPGFKWHQGQWHPASEEEVQTAVREGKNYKGPQIVRPMVNNMKTAEFRQGGLVLTDDKRDQDTKKKAPNIQELGKLEEGPGAQLGGPTSLKVNALPSKIANIVDVSGKNPEVIIQKRASVTHTALDGRYPLDSYADVQHAIRYFEDSGLEMLPEDRHEFCVKTASRAAALGLEMSEDMERYGSTEYALDVDAHLAGRRAVCEPQWVPVYNELQEKRAHIEPTEFAKLLALTDKEAGLDWHWGSHISDPYYATFGGNSEKLAMDWSWTGRVGDHVNAGQLKNLAINGRPLMHKHFSSDIVTAFQQDPIAIFESLPDTSKVILSRLASDMHMDGWAATN